MKKFFCFASFSLICLIASAQGTAINPTGTPADNSAMLDVSSADKGILVPRIALTDTVDATSIPVPAASLMVFNTTSGNGLNPGYYYNAGSPANPRWKQLLPNPSNAGLDMSGFKITNLATCTQNYDAANKAYVDAQVSQVGGSGGAVMPVMISDISSVAYNFRQACDYCRTLSEGGYTDWHIPTFEEIWYVVSSTAYPIPNSGSTSWLWVNQPDPGTGYYIMMVRLDNGQATRTDGANTNYVRCVR